MIKKITLKKNILIKKHQITCKHNVLELDKFKTCFIARNSVGTLDNTHKKEGNAKRLDLIFLFKSR